MQQKIQNLHDKFTDKIKSVLKLTKSSACSTWPNTATIQSSSKRIMRSGLTSFGVISPNPRPTPWDSLSSCCLSLIVASSITKSPCITFSNSLNKQPKSELKWKTITSLTKLPNPLLSLKKQLKNKNWSFCSINLENTFITTPLIIKIASTMTYLAKRWLHRRTKCVFLVSWSWMKLTVKCSWKILSEQFVSTKPN